MISILNLPKGSSLTLDGQTILLQRDDFVGIQGVPVDSDFHFLVARAAGCGSKEEQKHGNVAAVAVGFCVETSRHGQFSLVRRYDAAIEEVSSENVDAATATNLANRIQTGQVEPRRLVPYGNVVSNDQVTAWRQLTNFVSQRLLKARGIPSGCKIVPGCYGDDSEMLLADTTPRVQAREQRNDGVSVNYPPIPVLDGKNSTRHSRHLGTKRYLARLCPGDRTALFMESNPQNFVLASVLKRWYGCHCSDVLGDVQLSYILFLHLQCLTSLEHWRDLVSMLCSVDAECVEQHVDLYCRLMHALARQVTTIEQDFFEDIETSGDNFLVPTLKNLVRTTDGIPDRRLQEARTKLCQILWNRFRDAFSSIDNLQREEGARATETERSSDAEEAMEEDENMPVVVSNEEIEASLARSSLSSPLKAHKPSEQLPLSLQRKYPILFAAKMDHEDILMTCARALDDATDASLVREAGTYLVDEVEPNTADL